MFIPSGGGQWAVQGPVMIEAAKNLNVEPYVVVLGVGTWRSMDKYDSTILDNTFICHCWAPYEANYGLHICNIFGYWHALRWCNALSRLGLI